jgi:hypothetical protein
MAKPTWCEHFHGWIATESDGRQTKSSGQSKRDSKPIVFTIVSVTDIIASYRPKQCVPCQTTQQISLNSASRFTRNCTLPVRFIRTSSEQDYLDISSSDSPWSWKTVAKLPITLITPKMRPFLDRMVM